MKAVSDSTPLIHLSKIGKIELLKELFEEIIIPNEIYSEVIINGEKEGKNEILPIKKLIEEKFIVVKDTKSTIKIENLDNGEKACISLCKELKIDNILIDEKVGFDISLMFSLIPIRTTSLMLILLDKKIIDFQEYKEILKKLLESGYFLNALIYEKLLDIGKSLSK